MLLAAQWKPWLWWRYIADIFMVLLHEKEKFRDFMNFLNGAHKSVKFTAEWSLEKVNFLDV